MQPQSPPQCFHSPHPTLHTLCSFLLRISPQIYLGPDFQGAASICHEHWTWVCLKAGSLSIWGQVHRNRKTNCPTHKWLSPTTTSLDAATTETTCPPIKNNPISDSVSQVSTRQLRPALPNEFDRDRSKGVTFLRSCQTYIVLCPESFSDDQVKIIWALSYMKSGWAAKWAACIFKWEEENAGDSRLLDWDNFKSEFHKEFCPASSEATAINKLESTTYYQTTWSVDNYLDKFLDLVVESGYTDPMVLVVKFRRGLDPQIQNAMATMANGQLSDTAPTAWYKAARNVDQNRASNETFQSTHCTPAPNSLCPLAVPVLALRPPSVQAQAWPTPDHPIPMEVDGNWRRALVPPSCYCCGKPSDKNGAILNR